MEETGFELTGDDWWGNIERSSRVSVTGTRWFSLTSDGVGRDFPLCTRTFAVAAGAGECFQARVQIRKKTGGATNLCLVRFTMKPTDSEEGNPLQYWDLLLDPVSGRALPPGAGDGFRMGYVEDMIDSWQVTLVCEVQPGRVDEVSFALSPAIATEFGKYATGLRGVIELRGVEVVEIPQSEYVRQAAVGGKLFARQG